MRRSLSFEQSDGCSSHVSLRLALCGLQWIEIFPELRMTIVWILFDIVVLFLGTAENFQAGLLLGRGLVNPLPPGGVLLLFLGAHVVATACVECN